MATVYAKSTKEELLTHTVNCLSVFSSVRKQFPFIPQLCGIDDFWSHLFLAVFFHDFGKAASGFQRSLYGQEWGYRHEIISAGFVLALDLPHPYVQAVSLAVLTHHKDLEGLKEYRTTDSEGVGRARWREKVREVEPNFDYIHYMYDELPKLSREFLCESIDLNRRVENVSDIKDAFAETVAPYWCGNFEVEQLYGTFLRGLLVACDHLASSGQNAIREGLRNIGSMLGLPKQRPFQTKTARTLGHSLLAAPTGSGKTEAALLWASRNQSTSGRIYYVLPYTASINAMYRRFTERYGFGEENVGVLHGKAAYYVYKTMMERQYDRESAEHFARKAVDLTRKLYRPIKILTPFQIFKALFGVKGWESMISEMAGAVFVFDEIHVYEPHTTALILRSVEYLAGLDAKFLFLSATFPSFLKEKIRTILPLTELALDWNAPEEHELLYKPRHRCKIVEGQIVDKLDMIQSQLRNGSRVLVVCNTVKRAQEVFNSIKDQAHSAKLLHGRFILRDREAIEKELDKVQLLVGTQAIEVSLDIDFDVLFSEPAPVDALIQRFGRVNRRGMKGIAPVYIFSEGSDKDKYFYDVQRIQKTLSSLAAVDELNEIRIGELVEAVYAGGYSEREQREFERAWENFGAVLSSLYPFDEKETDEDFWELIRSLEVVPVKFEDEYKRLKTEKQYFEAMKLLASISFGQGAKLRSSGRLAFRKADKYWVANAMYDKQLGLLLDVEQPDIGIID